MAGEMWGFMVNPNTLVQTTQTLNLGLRGFPQSTPQVLPNLFKLLTPLNSARLLCLHSSLRPLFLRQLLPGFYKDRKTSVA